MRRKDREVTDPAVIRDIISHCTCCRLGFCDGGKAYIVPLNFGYIEEEGRYSFYFHSAREGRKIDLLRRTGWAAFEMDTHYELREAEQPCGYSARFQSVMGGGPVRIVGDDAEKEAALQALMLHTAGRGGWTFTKKDLDTVTIFRLDAEELSCKSHA